MAFLNVANLAESTLASGIDDDSTELSVQTGDGAKFPAGNFEVVVTKPDHSNFEVMLCSSRADDTLTVERGAGAVAHDADELVELRVTAKYVEELQDAITTHEPATTGVHGVGAGTIAKTSDITATKLDALTAPDDTTTLDVSTSKHGLAPKAVAPAAGLLNVFGIANTETAITNKAIFDNTNPAALGTAAPGTQVIAARRDHVHTNPVPTLMTSLFTPIAGEILRQTAASCPSPFSGLINNTPTSTSVVYDNDTNELSLKGISTGAGFWGRIMLYNSTRGTYRKIVSVDTATNTITTESSTDAWADNDAITTQSQVNTEPGYFDINLSAQIPAEATVLYMSAWYQDITASAYDSLRILYVHPYSAYDAGKRCFVPACPIGDVNIIFFFIPVISQKITVFYRGTANTITSILIAKGYY